MSTSGMRCEGVSSSVTVQRLTWAAVILFVGILLCTGNASANDDALAQADGEAITADDVAQFVGAPLTKLEEQI